MENNSLNYHAILETFADLFKAGKITYVQFHENYEKLLDTARIIRCEEEKTKQKEEETKQMEEKTKQKEEETKQIVSNNQTKQTISQDNTKRSIIISQENTKQTSLQEETKRLVSIEETKRVDIKEYSKMNSAWADALSPLFEAGGNFISNY